jgi:hypothetical protein
MCIRPRNNSKNLNNIDHKEQKDKKKKKNLAELGESSFRRVHIAATEMQIVGCYIHRISIFHLLQWRWTPPNPRRSNLSQCCSKIKPEKQRIPFTIAANLEFSNTILHFLNQSEHQNPETQTHKAISKETTKVRLN